MNISPPIVLASTSRIRQALLAGAGLNFITQSSSVDETTLKSDNGHLTPDKLAISLAAAKSLAVGADHRDAVVIGADQILVHQGQLFDKPSSLSAARRQLETLRNSTHQLLSAVCCTRNGQVIWQHCGEATLTMRDFTDAFLDSYVASCGADLLTSVGAYKLEGPGIQLFRDITGDYFTILGLPLLPLLDFLRRENIIAS